MEDLIGRRGAEKWHDDRLHQKFECNAENNPDGQTAEPALRPHVPNLAPRSPRHAHPRQNQNRAERRNDKITGEDNEDRKYSDRSESAQTRGKTVIGLERSGRFSRMLSSGFRQVRWVFRRHGLTRTR